MPGGHPPAARYFSSKGPGPAAPCHLVSRISISSFPGKRRSRIGSAIQNRPGDKGRSRHFPAVSELQPVYGPNVRGNFLSLIRLFVERGIPLPLGAVQDNRRSLLAVGNLADAIRRVLDAADPPGFGAYLLRDGEDLSTAALLRRLAAALDRPARLVAVPPAALATALRVVGRSGIADRLLGSLQIDDLRFRKTFG